MPNNLLITGATGLVGSHVARQAIAEGYHVLALGREGSDRRVLDGLPITWVEGDLADPQTLSHVLDDADIVVHAAAHIGDWGPAEQFRAINVIALEHLLVAARRVGRIERWIQISSLGVYPPRHHYGTDETTPANLAGLDGYTRTKAEGEVLIAHHMTHHQLPAVIIRPGFVYGPGDRHVVPHVVEKLANGTMRMIGRGDKLLNNTYVENLADAILLAARRPEALGETFNIRDGRLVTREEYLHTIADLTGLPRPRRVPEWLVRGLVRPVERIARWRGRATAPVITHARIKFMTLNLDFSIAKARRLLGYQPRFDFREGMAATLASLGYPTTTGAL